MGGRKPESSCPGGGLPVNKPVGPTSHDVVDCVRRQAGLRKVGHTGTLDPAAQGLLLLCIGGATRFAGYLSSLGKTYRATVRLGVATATDDGQGEVTSRFAGDLKEAVPKQRLEEAVSSFLGETLQVPPDYSAKKVAGEPAYGLARRGEKPPLKPVAVHTQRIEITGFALPEVEVEIDCSSGFYLRSFARDLGRKLGCDAHLASLVRTRIGEIALERAVSLGELARSGEADNLKDRLIRLEEALSFLPAVRLSLSGVEKVYFGRQLELGTPDIAGIDPAASALCQGLVQMQDKDGGFLGVALAERIGRQAGNLRPKRLLMEAFPFADTKIHGC